jgi:hypothetical protein
MQRWESKLVKAALLRKLLARRRAQSAVPCRYWRDEGISHSHDRTGTGAAGRIGHAGGQAHQPAVITFLERSGPIDSYG